MKNANLHMLAVIVSLLLTSVPCLAGSSTQLRVSAKVLPFVSLDVRQRVATYQVRSEDIRMGYVDLPESLTVEFSTNLNGVVPVSIENEGEGMIQVSESGTGRYAGSSFTLNTSGHGTGERIRQRLDTRIILPADAQEGTYPLNLAMTPAI